MPWRFPGARLTVDLDVPFGIHGYTGHLAQYIENVGTLGFGVLTYVVGELCAIILHEFALHLNREVLEHRHIGIIGHGVCRRRQLLRN